jgi:hypothetical protein
LHSYDPIFWSLAPLSTPPCVHLWSYARKIGINIYPSSSNSNKVNQTPPNFIKLHPLTQQFSNWGVATLFRVANIF